jgi:hypothetical protein
MMVDPARAEEFYQHCLGGKRNFMHWRQHDELDFMLWQMPAVIASFHLVMSFAIDFA